ncbi:MAG: hypothetical protein DME98_02785 [Verrucomicrobia bacterium]|nr:MAG: hypothetical protein DME98_02785 [Verrucomicrobiota bacterium]PYJ34157.1 MAG: hypothetical protein DME88_05970 [Verrucomicrobiota bacterium]
MVGRDLSLLAVARARRAFTRNDSLGSPRIKHDGWEAVTRWSLLISRITRMNANQQWRRSLHLLKRNSRQALEHLVGWIDDDPEVVGRDRRARRTFTRNDGLGGATF